MNIPKCVDCKWYSQDDTSPIEVRGAAYCVNPLNPVGDGIEGGDRGIEPCWRRREGPCGIEGRFFANSEEIEETPAPPLVTPKEQLLGTPLPASEAIEEVKEEKPRDYGRLFDMPTTRSALLGEDTDSPIRRE